MGMTALVLLLQGSEVSLSSSSSSLILGFLGVLAIAVLLQSFVLVAMAIGASRTQKKVIEFVEEFETRINPLIDKTHILLDDTTPKVRIISANLVQASYIVREQVENISNTVNDLNQRTRRRIVLLDGMVGAGMEMLDRTVGTLQAGILAPMRQLNGLLAGLRTGVDVLRNKGRKTHSNEDQDMFV